jgi:hypothetical protein
LSSFGAPPRMRDGVGVRRESTTTEDARRGGRAAGGRTVLSA